MVTTDVLDGYLGHSMRAVCPHGYDARNDNHCAHFVAHVLQLDFGVTCAALRGRRGAAAAANVRVHEIFARCPMTQEIIECPANGAGLIFVSKRSSFQPERVCHPGPMAMRMANVPKKHIGIVLNGVVWHYSNTRNQAVKQTAGEFLFHYRRQENALWWGAFPRTARATYVATSGVAI